MSDTYKLAHLDSQDCRSYGVGTCDIAQDPDTACITVLDPLIGQLNSNIQLSNKSRRYFTSVGSVDVQLIAVSDIELFKHVRISENCALPHESLLREGLEISPATETLSTHGLARLR